MLLRKEAGLEKITLIYQDYQNHKHSTMSSDPQGIKAENFRKYDQEMIPLRETANNLREKLLKKEDISDSKGYELDEQVDINQIDPNNRELISLRNKTQELKEKWNIMDYELREAQAGGRFEKMFIHNKYVWAKYKEDGKHHYLLMDAKDYPIVSIAELNSGSNPKGTKIAWPNYLDFATGQWHHKGSPCLLNEAFDRGEKHADQYFAQEQRVMDKRSRAKTLKAWEKFSRKFENDRKNDLSRKSTKKDRGLEI